ncbi:hypothetical protein FIBSPDRAFT_744359 [Athelia psychrophila]|uniref:Peptidase S33 tripeptidyl aminopeptidase-like C-terminal domain-containing protein n=1 Tax=Athelia psychrophila TaxID=1759441 RepID=A0A166HPE5_9AGAM|nr:hypothetical protein FIBSPDRAFT_744359 [Fibularhizoctonia sp. CBS 109695]
MEDPPAKWNRSGYFGAQNIAHPLLVLSSTADPVTPLEHARAVAARYGRAKLVVQKSVGHSTFASAPSLCAVKHLRAYYANGTMPEDGVV